MTDHIRDILAQREVTHGPFALKACIARKLKSAMCTVEIYGSSNLPELEAYQRESLEMIQFKVAGILAGNPFHVDHWDDIAGYATLVADQLRSDATNGSQA